MKAVEAGDAAAKPPKHCKVDEDDYRAGLQLDADGPEEERIKNFGLCEEAVSMNEEAWSSCAVSSLDKKWREAGTAPRGWRTSPKERSGGTMKPVPTEVPVEEVLVANGQAMMGCAVVRPSGKGLVPVGVERAATEAKQADCCQRWEARSELLSVGLARDHLQEQLWAADLRRHQLSVVDRWDVRRQRLWAANVGSGEPAGVQSKATWILREWSAEREMKFGARHQGGATGTGSRSEPKTNAWTGAPRRVESRVLDLSVLVLKPAQWLKVTVREVQGGSVALIDSDTAAEWKLPVCCGAAQLRVRWDWGKQCTVVRVRVEDPPLGGAIGPGLRLPSHWATGWRQPVAQQPSVQEDGLLKWDAVVQPQQLADEESVQRWWGERAEEALRECLDPNADHLGGFFETPEVAPDERVLGAWVLEKLARKVDGVPVVQRTETTHASNPAWAKARHEAQVFKAGQLHQFVEQWREAGADDEVLSWLIHGYHITIRAPPVDSGREVDGWQGIRRRNGAVAREHPEDLQLVVLEVLKKEAWEVVLEKDVVNELPLNLTPKPGKEPPWRLILNCIELNEYVPLWSVRYETLRTVPLVVEKDDWVFSIDFTDAYYQLHLDDLSKRLVGAAVEFTQEQVRELRKAGLLPPEFEWDRAATTVRVRVRPKGLPMGFRNSCAIWTKVARVLTTLWRRKGFKLVHLIDDLLFSVTGTYEEACRVRDEVLADLDRLGVFVNWKKSVLEPSKCTRFLGMLVDTLAYRFFVPPDKIEKLKAVVAHMVQQPEATVRALASVVGKVMSMSIAVPAVRMVTAGLYRLVRPEGDWDRAQVVTTALVEELCAVLEWVCHFSEVGNPIRRMVGMAELRIFVDAGTGYGWRLCGQNHTAEFEGHVLAKAADWEDDQQDLWQPWKELWALYYAIEAECEAMAGCDVLVRPDATTTVAYVNKGSGPSAELTKVMRMIFTRCVEHGIGLRAEHLTGVRMIATGVDSLSRMSEFTVSAPVFRWLNSLEGFGRRQGYRGFTVDLYASKKTAKCVRYAARGAPEGAIGDARTLVLGSTELYWVMPPLSVVAEAVAMVLGAGVAATVVVPDWPDQPWHVLLRHKAKGFVFLRWHEDKPVMWDVSVRTEKHAHLADKWDFVAFTVGGAEAVAPVELWRERRDKAKAGQRKRKRVQPAMWRPKAQRRAIAEAAKCASAEQPEQLPVRTGDGILRLAGRRVLRVLSLFDGCGTVMLALEQLKVTAEVEVITVELDPDCEAFVRWRFSNSTAGWSSDVNDWAADAFAPAEFGTEFWFDLVVAGFPCQDVSSANKYGEGLLGNRSALFFKAWRTVEKLQEVNPKLQFLLECTDFSRNWGRDFELVGDTVGVQPVVVCASRVAACYRKRAYWASFDLPVLEVDSTAVPESVLEPGRWTDWPKLPTVVASGVHSWNTAKVVYDEQRGGWAAGKWPLYTVEMERAMGMPDGFTAMPGLPEPVRHRLIGNSFQLGVLVPFVREWLLLLREFDATIGFQGEGPSQGEKTRKLRGLGQQQLSKAVRKQGKALAGLKKQPSKPKGSKPVAAWRRQLPAQQQQCTGMSLGAVLNEHGWGSVQRSVLDVRAGHSKKKLVAPQNESFRQWAGHLVHDLVLSSRSESTWKAYKAWMEVFQAFLDKFGVEKHPDRAVKLDWIEVLAVVVAVFSQCYGASTIGVFVSAVSSHMQDYEIGSPYDSRMFSMLMKGVVNYLGAGKAKKPPVEDWHVAAILQAPKPEKFTMLQHYQGLVVLVLGWQLFTRSQDFPEFQACDFIVLETGLRVLVRYAKNDQKGLTRQPVLERGKVAASCPVRLYLRYVGAAGIRVQPCCTKVEGKPHRCTVCPPAFPSITQYQGKKDRPMPKARVSEILKVYFRELAAAGRMTEEEAEAFSSKSLRCGGVSQAAAETIRDGVVQGHGGWLQRQSLVHYDQMRPGEKPFVSRALNTAVEKWLHAA